MMKIHKLPYQKITQFSATDIAYQTNDPRLGPFYEYQTALDAFGKIIQKKNFSAKNREVLSTVLKEQYKNLDVEGLVAQNIERIEVVSVKMSSKRNCDTLLFLSIWYIPPAQMPIHIPSSMLWKIGKTISF